MDLLAWDRGCFLVRHDIHCVLPLTRWSEVQRFINPWSAEDCDTQSGSDRIRSTRVEQQQSVFPRVQVPHALWNDYWLQYSEVCGDHVERLQSSLSTHNGYVVGDDDGCDSSCMSRCVQVSLASNDEIPNAEKTSRSMALLLTVLVFYARHCGSVEMVSSAPSPLERPVDPALFSPTPDPPLILGWIQFTTHAAAKMFRLWLQAWKVNSLCSQFRADILALFPEVFTRRDVGDGQEEEKEPSFDQLVEHLCRDSNTTFTSTLTRSITKGSVTLCVGPNIFLSTAFLNSLFCGMMDATSVEYSQQKSNSFLIRFKDKDAALLALHALQYSLWIVFGLSLITIIE